MLEFLMKKDNKKMAIGKNLKYICKMRGMTLKELSEKSGIPIGTIYSITQRDPDSINSETMKNLCIALGISSDSIVYGDLLGMYEGYGIPKEEKKAINNNGLGALLDLDGYDLTFSEYGIFLIYPGGKKYISPEVSEKLTAECSKLVKYVLNDFLINSETDG